MSHRINSRKQSGFTLIELMLVVVVVAILAAVAIPSYRSHIVKSNRAAAEAFILSVANKQEQYMLDARRYSDTLGTGGLGMTPPSDVSKNYTISISGVTATTAVYEIVADPTGAQDTNDTQCGRVSIDQTGAKRSEFGSASACW